ncbi:hypothetical protein KXW38_002050, partial [Aspergillus fumigatus]
RARGRAEILRRGAADRGRGDVRRRGFRHHGVHRGALQSRRQRHAEGDRRHEPRKGGLSPDRIFRQQRRLECRPQVAKGSRRQARGGDASRVQFPLLARPACRQIRLSALGREGIAAAVAVERRCRAKGRDHRCGAAAGLHRASAAGNERRKVPGLGRRRDAVA